MCGLPSETGPCKGAFKRYFYNVKSGKCESFVYGGCKGNANNFKTLLGCKLVCSKSACACMMLLYTARVRRYIVMMRIPVDSRVVCNASPDPGMCYGYFPKFFHNPTSGKCERFVYGGCQGNANRFNSKEQCLDKCGQLCSCMHVVAHAIKECMNT